MFYLVAFLILSGLVCWALFGKGRWRREPDGPEMMAGWMDWMGGDKYA